LWGGPFFCIGASPYPGTAACRIVCGAARRSAPSRKGSGASEIFPDPAEQVGGGDCRERDKESRNQIIDHDAERYHGLRIKVNRARLRARARRLCGAPPLGCPLPSASAQSDWDVSRQGRHPLHLPPADRSAPIQNDSGLPQGPADPSPVRVLMRQTACVFAVPRMV
jgi:hypothetical protein